MTANRAILRLTFFLVAGFILFTPHAHAAIAFDASSTINSTGFGAGGTFTGTHVTGGGTNTFMVMCSSIFMDVAPAGTISSASYNSVALTQASTTFIGNMRVDMWYLVAPAAGSHTTSMTVSGNSDDRRSVWTTYTGVAQSSPVDSFTSNLGTATAIATTTRTTVANDMLEDCVSHFGTQKLVQGAGQTLISTSTVSSSEIGASYKATSTITSTGQMSFTTAGSNDWAYMVLAFKQAATVVVNTASSIFTIKGSMVVKGGMIVK